MHYALRRRKKQEFQPDFYKLVLKGIIDGICWFINEKPTPKIMKLSNIQVVNIVLITARII